MNRIKQAYIVAKEVIIRRGRSYYDYRIGLPLSILLLLSGFFVENIFGDILIILGLVVSPLIFWLEGFWMFVIYLIKPK